MGILALQGHVIDSFGQTSSGYPKGPQALTDNILGQSAL